METNIITSVSNNKIKILRSLNKKQFRKEHNLFCVEGEKVISDAISSGAIITELYVNAEKLEKFTRTISYAQKKLVPVHYVNNKVMDAISSTKSPQGIVATIDINLVHKDLNSLSSLNFITILDGISDPGNLGTIIRTCDAVGVQALVLGNNCVDIFNVKVIRSSMGSVFNIKLIESTNLNQDIKTLLQNKWQIGCGHLNGINFFDRVQKDKVALVIGNEAKGVNNEISQLCTDTWKLPMRGKAESLNAAIAAGIMLYDISNIFLKKC